MPHDPAPIPEQFGPHCPLAHEITPGINERNIGLAMNGQVICLQCLSIIGDAPTRIAGRLLAAVILPAGLAQLPSREEVYGS